MMNNVFSIMDLIFAGAGIYALYAYVQLKTKNEFTTSLLMSKDVEIRKCKDIEGYKAFILPKILIFGIAALLYGGVGLINTYVLPLPGMVYTAAMILFFAVLIWYAYQTKKGVQMFW
jgi:hypothetical protein